MISFFTILLTLILAGRVAPESKDNSALFPLNTSTESNERNIVMSYIQPEQWTPIKGYENFYTVSNFGRVKSFKRQQEKLLKLRINDKGYQTIMFYKDGQGKNYSVHTLVWEHFGDKPRNGRKLQVDHKDNNKLNNYIGNLQLLSARDNMVKSVINKYNKTSKYVGVSYYSKSNKWRVGVCANGKTMTMGYFDNEYDAHLQYTRLVKLINYLT